MTTGAPAALARRRVAVEVPATAANLGAGYDCVGIALDLGLSVVVEAAPDLPGAVEMTVDGEGAEELPRDRSNRLVAALDAALDAAGVVDPASLGWRVRMTNRIPLSRGLGSSAAATVAGIVAADALLGGAMARERMLAIATTFEGHPDNAAPALFGGFTVAGRVAGPDGVSRVEAIRFDLPARLRAVLLIPDLPLSTAAMRAALPATVPHADAVHNIAAVGLGVAGIASGRVDLLRALTVDRIHEPYRAVAYPQLPGLVAAALDAGAIGASLSGAGSTILSFVDDPATVDRVAAALRARAEADGLAARIHVSTPQNVGAHVV